MERLGVGLTIFIYFCCLFKLSQVAASGESCVKNDDCKDNTACLNGNCSICAAGYKLNADQDGCIASGCFEAQLFSDSNAERDCVAVGNNLVCNSICKTGYMYSDRKISKPFTCTLTNMWNDEQSTHDRFCLISVAAANECIEKVKEREYGVFVVNSNSLFCDGGTRSLNVESVEETAGTKNCPIGYYLDGEICLSHGPAQYFDVASRTVKSCPDGQYQDRLAQTSCKECPSGQLPNSDKTGCRNLGNCFHNPCLNGGTCTNIIDDFYCSCRSGFSSKTCSVADLGESCAVEGTTCKDPNSDCGNGNICICKSSYYDDNDLSIGGTCRQPPGKVTDLKSIVPFRAVYTLLQISWKAPAISLQNSPIKEYTLDARTTDKPDVTQTLSHEETENHVYTVVLTVIPDRWYTMQVTAVDVQGMIGEMSNLRVLIPAGVPVNIEETLNVDVITLKKGNDLSGRQLTVSIKKDFFEESTNGPINATGLIVCLIECNIKGINTLSDFITMVNWNEAQEREITTYRTTKPSWLDEIETQGSCGRKKRDVTNIEYTVGSEDCANISPDEFCNGPLQPATSFSLVAVSCTSGGCLTCRKYGPFTTATVAQCTRNDNSTVIIIGAVLGVMNLISILYSGYATVLIRRLKAKDRQEIRGRADKQNSQTYVNEVFTKNTTGDGRCKNINESFEMEITEDSRTKYLGLDDKTRDDRTYDIINSYEN